MSNTDFEIVDDNLRSRRTTIYIVHTVLSLLAPDLKVGGEGGLMNNRSVPAVVAAHTLDWLSFAGAVTIAPVLLSYELGFIGMVTAQLGLLGALAWKMAGLSVALALSTYVHPRPRRLLLVLTFLAGAVGLVGNTYALTQVMM